MTGIGGLSTGATSLTYTGDQVNAGIYYVTAHYAGDANHLPSDGAAVPLTIWKAHATVVVTPYSVTYDANPHTASYTIVGVGTDTSAAGSSITLDTTHTNAGTYSDDSWSFSGGNNYYDISPTTITDAIGAFEISGSVTALDKEYDGTRNAAISDPTLSGVFSGDSVSLVGGTGLFSDKNVGSDKTITITGLTLASGDAGNYILSNPTETTTASIIQRTLTVTASGVGKIYDGNNNASVILSDDRVSGDVLVIGYSASFTDKNAGVDKTINVTSMALSGTDALNYKLAASSITTSATIAMKAIVGYIKVANKVYDGTTAAIITGGGFVGLIGGDIVGFGTGTATFSDSNVGTGKKVTVTGLTLSGPSAGNYVLINPTETYYANITPRTLTVTAYNYTRVFGQPNPAFSGSVSGLISADGISLVYGTSATQFSKAGAYTITPTLKDPNHACPTMPSPSPRAS